MAKINLLPWREEARQELTRQFLTLLIMAVVFTICMLGLVHVNINLSIGHQEARNKILEAEIVKLDKALTEIEELENTKDKLLSRMDVIQSLQQKRPQIVHLFDEIVRTVPEGIFLTSLKQSGASLSIVGIAESNGRVSAYMRNIDASDWMATPKLNVIETKAGSFRSSDFVLTTSQSAPKDEEE